MVLLILDYNPCCWKNYHLWWPQGADFLVLCVLLNWCGCGCVFEVGLVPLEILRFAFTTRHPFILKHGIIDAVVLFVFSFPDLVVRGTDFWVCLLVFQVAILCYSCEIVHKRLIWYWSQPKTLTSATCHCMYSKFFNSFLNKNLINRLISHKGLREQQSRISSIGKEV